MSNRRVSLKLLVVLGVLAGLTQPAAGPAGAAMSFFRGEVNADGGLNISDPVYMLVCMFLGSECPTCADAADVDR